MWVNSKEAAAILGVKYDTLKRSIFRAKKSDKKICTIKGQNCLINQIDGRGGASGKILQIWIDDEIVAAHNVSDKEGSLREIEEFRSEISPADITSNAITTRVGSLNFITKEANASGNDRKYPSSWGSKNDEAGASAIHSGKEGGNSSRTREYHAREFSEVKSSASAIPTLCKENASYGLRGENDGSRGVWLEDKGGVDDKHGASDNPTIHSSNNHEFADVALKENTINKNPVKTSEAVDERLPLIATCSDKKRKAAFEKYEVLKEWEKAKGKISVAAFIDYINTKKVCSIKVTANKLFDWQRKFKKGGLDALVDERTNNKKLKLEEYGVDGLCIELILACKAKGKVDITGIYKTLNYHLISCANDISVDDFHGKKDECISYEVVNRFVNSYLNDNKLVKNIILYGEDGAVGRHLPALGRSNWAVDSINQIVEIDASPLDLICNASDICNQIGFNAVNNIFKDKDEFENFVKEWQKRYTIIALIDTYSGVATFHISDTENSVGIARAVAKYILRYGKPRAIKGDNGKAFKSEYINSVMNALGIEYRAVRAYSGWLKPYVERNFRALQHNFTANLAGFIGHNIAQRQAIEFFFSKKERRLKKGYKTNLKELKNLSEVQSLMDMYAEKFLNNRYLERLGMTCREAYDERVSEAVAMDAVSLSARLSQSQIKHVSKKGISVDGVMFYSIDMFAYEKVVVRKNIDNVNECFLWNEGNEFIGVASTLDMQEGVSVETAKASQKLFNKRLKETKGKMNEASIKHQEDFTRILKSADSKTAAKPKIKTANNEGKEIDIARKKSRNLTKNPDLCPEYMLAAVKGKEKSKIKGFEEMAEAKLAMRPEEGVEKRKIG